MIPTDLTPAVVGGHVVEILRLLPPRSVQCVVLDPFAGSGTTLAVARGLGRRSIGIDLNPEYVALARRRSGGDQPSLEAFTESPSARSEGLGNPVVTRDPPGETEERGESPTPETRADETATGRPRSVGDMPGPSDGGRPLPHPETVTPRPRLPVVTLDAWE